MARPLDGTTRDKIVEMYAAEASYTTIQRECKVSGPTITKVAKQAGLPLRKRPAHLRSSKEEHDTTTENQSAPSPPDDVPIISGNEMVDQLTPEKKTMAKKTTETKSADEDQEWECPECGALMEGDKPTNCLHCGVQLA